MSVGHYGTTKSDELTEILKQEKLDLMEFLVEIVKIRFNFLTLGEVDLWIFYENCGMD